jgi:alkylation response protein AidB-like acyl-CoA dehydrogenase
MSLDLAFDDGQRAIFDSLEQFCSDRCSEEDVKREIGKFPSELWREIAELGVLALATPEGDGGAIEAVAACEALGGAVFPGPLTASFFATQVLGERERVAVAAGAATVSVGSPPLMPWAADAQIYLEVADDRVWRCSPAGAVEPVPTLGGEPWGRVDLVREEELSGAPRALALYELTLAAYLAAAGQRLVATTAEHARTRKQFGGAIGEFQAVAHPLADCFIRLRSAASLARAAACEFDADDSPRLRVVAAAARLSARGAAVAAVHVCHQLFGALGITTEGPVFHVSRRIRQLASQPPGDASARAAVLAHSGL